MSDKTIRRLATAAVLLVAAIAAVVSYQHLYHLAVTHGETRMDSALIPLSIDGTVVTASLLMLRAARLGLRTPWLARCMLALAVTMTVAANVAFGWQYAAWGVFIAGWPAAAFLLNAESSISFGRKTSLPAAVPVVAEPVKPDRHAEMAAKKTELAALKIERATLEAEGMARRLTVAEQAKRDGVKPLTVKQQATILGKHPRTVARYRADGVIDDMLAAVSPNGKVH